MQEARTQKTLVFEMHLLSTISEVQSKCASLSSIPVACQELLFLGKVVAKRRCLLDLVDWAESDEPDHVSQEDSLLLIAQTGSSTHEPVYMDFVLNIVKSQADQFGSMTPLHVLRTKNAQSTLTRVLSGMNRRLNPEPTPEGLSGSYFLKDRFRNRVAIFKPLLQEPFAPLNPKNLQAQLGTEVHVSGIKSGSLYLREMAAYLIDHKGVFSVPDTFVAAVEHPFFERSQQTKPLIDFGINQSKAASAHLNTPSGPESNLNLHSNLRVGSSSSGIIGSVQKMVINNGSVSNISVSKLPTLEVQKIAILDMLILNADRNEGNILFQRGRKGIRLIPIDHGLSLGSVLQIRESEVVWTSFPQIKSALVPELIEHVKSMRPEKLARRLKRKLRIEQDSLDLLRLMGIFLKRCVQEGLTIAEMAELYYRKEDDKQSPLERMIGGVEFMACRARKSQEWYEDNQIVARRRKMSKRSLDDIIGKMEKRTGKGTGGAGSQRCSLSLVSQKEPKNQKYNKNEKAQKSKFLEFNTIFQEDLNTDSIIFSSEMERPETDISNEDISSAFSKKPKETAETADRNALDPLRLPTVQSLSLSEAHSTGVPPDAEEVLRIQSEEHSRPSGASLDPLLRLKSERVGAEVIGGDMLKMEDGVKNSVSTTMTLSRKSQKMCKKSEFFGESQRRGRRRSLSVFLSCSRNEENSKMLFDSTTKKEKIAQIGSFLQIPGKKALALKGRLSPAQSGLKFHYFECFLEQYLEGRRYSRNIHRARRKYTICVNQKSSALD